jgi:prevent-host-death family protein
MAKTQVRPSRGLRNNYASVVKSLEQHDHVIITNNGVGEAVLIGFEDYGRYEEYLHRQFIYEELQKSKAKMSDPSAMRHDADGVHAELEQMLETLGL